MTRTGFILSISVFLASCSNPPEHGDFVARVGDRTLTREEVRREISNNPILQDSLEVTRQIIERWISNELLFQEAVDQGLRSDEEVMRLLADNERSVLISALVNRFYEDEAMSPDNASIRTYYEQHREQLSLREPFLRVRHLVYSDPEKALQARDSLRTFSTDDTGEARFNRFADQAAKDATVVSEISGSYYPQSQLFSQFPRLAQPISGLNAGGVLGPMEEEGRIHVIQLVDRLPVGTIPEMELLVDELRERVAIEMRKQLFARQVQRLRTRALAREELEIRELP